MTTRISKRKPNTPEGLLYFFMFGKFPTGCIEPTKLMQIRLRNRIDRQRLLWKQIKTEVMTQWKREKHKGLCYGQRRFDEKRSLKDLIDIGYSNLEFGEDKKRLVASGYFNE